MRVLHVLHNSLPLICGYSIRSGYIVRTQRMLGVEPIVVTSPQNPDPQATAPESLIDGVTHYRTARPSTVSAPGLREWQLMRALQSRVEQLIERERPDVVHAHSPVLVGLPALRAARRAGVPFVYEVRDLWENASVDRGRFRDGSLIYRAARRLETEVLRRADAAVAICDRLRDELEPRARQAVSVVANGVDISGFAPRAEDAAARARWNVTGRRVIAYVGTFQPYEGLELLVQATASIARDEPDACLVIAGGSADPNGPMEARLRELVDRVGVQAHVRFTGRLPHAEVNDVYAMADVVVYPRIDTRTTALTTPLKPLEAMSMAKAVVMSDLPALRELVKPETTGIMFKAGDARELAAACVRLLRDPHLRRRIGEEACAWTHRERNWPALISRYAAVYDQAISKSARGTATERVASRAAAL